MILLKYYKRNGPSRDASFVYPNSLNLIITQTHFTDQQLNLWLIY